MNYSNIVPIQWDIEQTLHKMFPYDIVENIVIKPYPMISDDKCELIVMVNIINEVGYIDESSTEFFINDYMEDLDVEYKIKNISMEAYNSFRVDVEIEDFENFLLEKVNKAKYNIKKIDTLIESLSTLEYVDPNNEYPGFSLSQKEESNLIETIQTDTILGSTDGKITSWKPTSLVTFKDAIKFLSLGKFTADQNPVNLLCISDTYYINGDGFNRVCAAKALGIQNIHAKIKYIDYQDCDDSEKYAQYNYDGLYF